MPNAITIEPLPPFVAQLHDYSAVRATMTALDEICVSGFRRELYQFMLDRLPAGFTVESLSDGVAETKERTRSAIYDLIDAGLIRREGSGNARRTFYAIPPRLS